MDKLATLRWERFRMKTSPLWPWCKLNLSRNTLASVPLVCLCCCSMDSPPDIFPFSARILSDLGNSLICLGRLKIEKTSRADRPAASCYWSVARTKDRYELVRCVRHRVRGGKLRSGSWQQEVIEKEPYNCTHECIVYIYTHTYNTPHIQYTTHTYTHKHMYTL